MKISSATEPNHLHDSLYSSTVVTAARSRSCSPSVSPRPVSQHFPILHPQPSVSTPPPALIHTCRPIYPSDRSDLVNLKFSSFAVNRMETDTIAVTISYMPPFSSQAPIYVSKQIVTTDAIQIAYGMIRTRSSKLVYDVTLDSPAEGPDILVNELSLIQNMKLAVSEERYNDAAIIRDQLIELRKM